MKKTISARKKIQDRPVQTSKVERCIGEFGGEVSGPTVICLAGIHGNEPAAVSALSEVVRTLRAHNPPFRGKFAAIAGNLSALSRSVRYVEEDLNRIWTPRRIGELTDRSAPQCDQTVEQREQRQLFDFLGRYVSKGQDDLYVLDLHTTSSPSPPFIIIADTIRNRKFALQFNIPIILGLEELLQGTLMQFLGDLGIRTLAFEAGRHQDPASLENHIAATWVALVHAGCLSSGDVAGFRQYQDTLLNAASDIPRVFEVRERYEIHRGENFRMTPGFHNFQKVSRGSVLACNDQGEIVCSKNGYIFMPLYQPQGEDGYFIIRRINVFWLKISEWLRRLKANKIIPFLPGIRKHPRQAEELIINPRIARWYVLEIVHLLGYRRQRWEDQKLIVAKRKYDL